MDPHTDYKQVELAARRRRAVRRAVTYVLLALWAVIVLFPFYWMLISSVKTLEEYRLSVPTFWPRVLMLENAVYAILSPEGFASILWKDAGRSGEAADLMKLTAPELLRLRVIDEVILEPAGGAHLAPAIAYREVDQALFRHLSALSRERGSALTAARYEKFRRMGVVLPNEDAPRKEEP